MIYTIRTTAGREDIVVDLLMSKIETDAIDVKSVFHPAEIKDYIFVEAALGAVQKAMVGLMHSRGLIAKPVQLSEIQHFLESKKARLNLDEGDILEIIGGPFKGEKGRVIRVNKIKDEITAELLEASIPIPVTISTEFVKILKRAHPSEGTVAEKEAPQSEGSVFDNVQPGAQEGTKAEPVPAAEPAASEKKTDEKKKKRSFLEELEDLPEG